MKISHYLIERPLGVGGMGEVFVAFDEHLQRKVAIKLLPAARALDSSARARMLREARAASALQHPGIVTIHEIGADDSGRTFIVMELVDGETFAQVLARRERLPPDEAIELVAQVADAVGVAHEAGILHRDLKPANLMIDRRGRVKVLDFGLSKRLGTASVEPASVMTPVVAVGPISADAPTATPDPVSGDAATVLPTSSSLDDAVDVHTVDGARMGTPGYAALELVRGETADVRSDVFSLAVVLYELVTGKLPFPNDTWTTLIAALERGSPPSSGFPKLDAAIAPALRPDPAARYPDVATLVARARQTITPPRRSPLPWIAAAVAVTGAAVGAWAVTRSPGGKPAAIVPDAAPAPSGPRRAADARALTATDACAYSPAFADADTVAFDLTKDGAIDLYAVPLAGGAPRLVAGGPMMEWRAAPGARPGEIVYLVTDTGERGVTYIDSAVLATGATRRVVELAADSVATVGEALIYPTSVGPELRRYTPERDDVVATLPADHAARLVTVAPDQRHVAVQARRGAGVGTLCVADLQDGRGSCPVEPIIPARPAWSSTSDAIFYASAQGIRRHALDAPDGKDDPLVVEGAAALGGIAVAPDGDALVWSTCGARGWVIDVAHPTEKLVVAEGAIDDLHAGANGALVYIQASAALRAVMFRDPAGSLRELTGPNDPSPRFPALSPDGTSVAYVLGDPEAGVYLQATDGLTRAKPISQDKTAVSPRWLDDDRLAYVTWDERNVYWISIYDRRDATTVKVDAPRLLWGKHPETGALLVSRDGEDGLYWRDLATGKERRWNVNNLPSSANTTNIVSSPNGRWVVVQAGQMSNRALRIDVLANDPTAELVYEASQDLTLGRLAVSDDGTVYAAPNGWSGELYALDGRY